MKIRLKCVFSLIIFLNVFCFAQLKQICLTAQEIETNIKEYTPLTFVTPRRFDLMAKYIYAKHREWAVKSAWASHLYVDHIRVWINLRDFISHKRGATEFLKAFDKTLDSIKKDGFLPEKSIVPLGYDDDVMDGAHRITACLLYGKSVYALPQAQQRNAEATADFFKNKTRYVKSGLQEQYLDAMAIQYCQLKPNNTYFLVKFPHSSKQINFKIDEYIKKIGELIYKKNICLNRPGFVNLLRELYPMQPWLGNYDNNFNGACGLADKYTAGKGSGEIEVYFFECKEKQDIEKIKIDISNAEKKGIGHIYFNYGNQESLIIAQMLFNRNSLYFLQHAYQKHFEKFESLIEQYKMLLKKSECNQEWFCVYSSAVLAAHGICDCNEIAFIHHGPDEHVKKYLNDGALNSHNNEIAQYHTTTKDDLIFNPNHFFYYRGIKFLTLNELMTIKQKRNLPKDNGEIQSIQKFLLSSQS